MVNPFEKAKKRKLDKEFRRWIQTLPSCISGDYSEWVHGEGRNIAAHVRRAGNSGTAHKPLFSCVPLTHNEHMKQHQEGESALAPQDYFEETAERLLKVWCSRNGYDVEGLK